MIRLNKTKYYILKDGSVVRPLKARVKGSTKMWNLFIDGKLKAYTQKTLKELYDRANET